MLTRNRTLAHHRACDGLIFSHRTMRSAMLWENPRLNKTEHGMWGATAGLVAAELHFCWLPCSGSRGLRFRPGETWVSVPSYGPVGARGHKVSLRGGNQVPGATREGECYGLARQSRRWEHSRTGKPDGPGFESWLHSLASDFQQ